MVFFVNVEYAAVPLICQSLVPFNVIPTFALEIVVWSIMIFPEPLTTNPFHIMSQPALNDETEVDVEPTAVKVAPLAIVIVALLLHLTTQFVQVTVPEIVQLPEIRMLSPV